ncbi:alpha/beta hydrolase [Lactovum odontotermitis]
MSNFTTNDKVAINFHEYGLKTGQAVIFVNGYSASEATWMLQIGAFSKEKFHVITYDHRSHGRSDKVNYGLSAQRLAMDLKELIDYLQLEKVVLVGHSMGAAVILAYEQMFTDANLSAVVTEDQSPLFLKSPDWLNGSGKNFADLAEFMDDFPRTHLTKKPLSDALKREIGKNLLPFDFQLGRPLLQNVITQDWRPVLEKEAVPHLFLAGSESPVFPPEHAQAALALTHNKMSQCLTFTGCGHIPHLEDASLFDEAVINFIESVDEK